MVKMKNNKRIYTFFIGSFILIIILVFIGVNITKKDNSNVSLKNNSSEDGSSAVPDEKESGEDYITGKKIDKDGNKDKDGEGNREENREDKGKSNDGSEINNGNDDDSSGKGSQNNESSYDDRLRNNKSRNKSFRNKKNSFINDDIVSLI